MNGVSANSPNGFYFDDDSPDRKFKGSARRIR